MATTDDLSNKDISEMSIPELHEHLRQIRHDRRVPSKKPKKPTKKQAEKKLTPEQAKAILAALGEG